MRRLTPLNAPGLEAAVVHVRELRQAGVKDWRMNAGDLETPMRGTRARPGLDGNSFEARAKAVQLLIGEGRFISRLSAATLLLVPVPKRNDLIDVGAVRPHKPPRRLGVAGHQIQPGVLSRVPVAPHWLPAPEDAWALLGAVCRVEDLVVAGDHLISTTRKSRGPGCSFEDLVDASIRFGRCQGVGNLKAALPQVRHGVASPPETMVRLRIVKAGFEEPVTNCLVPTYGRVLHADLGYPQWRIAIEYDGAYHFEHGPAQMKFDNERCERMIDAGWTVLRLTSLDLKSPAGFLRRLARAIERAKQPK
ncbi:endonuclease domain-containing protein [Leucobacter salsicius]|uniref:endonuclease domain-containing protein n=1 Tax=Leucobacter salsicius TaxID=664638 RepID=UPI000344DE70|nr:hypothetical protein [Leucobacter salsicius]